MDLYQLVRDLIEEARKQKNLELVDKLIEIKLAISDIQDENDKLKKELEQQVNVIRHADGNYITLKDDDLQIKYCSTCWGNDNKLIQLSDDKTHSDNYPKCPICFNKWLSATKGK